ncbi:DUF4261 domain-containing protein [Rhizobium sp. RU36D]|uniref:DUF4261 domain-containing protein n=1 Tax=Rhizobium sp. RU36D TaxID=1907415 RepID=UPI000A02C2B2|nr:DUF4261 domain-containing protein [Rhizobium sp. RU36D]
MADDFTRGVFMQFISMVFFDRVVPNLLQDLATVFASQFPNVRFDILDSNENPENIWIVSVDDQLYGLILYPVAPTMDEFHWAARQNILWGGGSEAIVRTKAHLVIGIRSHESANPLRVARGLTLLAGAASRFPGAITGHWGLKARNLMPAQIVVKAAAEAYQGRWPAILWHRLEWFKIARPTSFVQRVLSFKSGEEGGSWGLTTVGMSEFVGREVEMEVDLTRRDEAVSLLLDVSSYILGNWKKIKHNDTLGGEEPGSLMMRIQKREKALSSDGPSYTLVPQTVN